MSTVYKTGEGGRAVRKSYDAVLESWPVPFERLRVPTAQVETFIVACGPVGAPALVLLHGTGTNSAMWMGDAAAWAEHFRVYAVDLLGEPGLSPQVRPPLATEAYAAWLDEVLAALDIEHASFVGISLGGWLALDYTIRRPGRTDRLALMCPSGLGRQKWAVIAASLVLLPFGRWGERRMMRLALGRIEPAVTPAGRAFEEHMLLAYKHFRPRRGKIPVFGDDALRTLTMPVLAIVGARDNLLDSRGTRRRLERAVPDATVEVLPRTGHLIRGQTRPILDFLRTLETTP